VGEFLGISAGGVLDWLPVSSASGDMLKSENLSGLASYPTARTNLGLGTTDTPTFKNLVISTGSIATSAPVTISQTWNAGTNEMTALKVVATDTASGTTSNLLELWSGSTAALKFRVSKGGGIVSKANIITADGATGAAGLSLEMVFANYGIGIDSNGNTAFLLNGLAKSRAGFGVAIASDQSLSFTNTTHVGSNATADTILLRDGAPNTLALRNSTAPQTFNVYGTWTTAITNFERLAIKYNGSDLAYQIAAEKGTTNGDYRPLQLWTGGASRLAITAAGNVGIGTTAPTVALEVAGNGRFTGGYPYIDLKPNHWASPFYFQSGVNANGVGTGDYTIFLNPTGKGFNFLESSTSRLVILPTSGNVGIGTTAPSSKLHVVGNGLFGEKISTSSATPLNVSFGGTYGTSAPGSKANLKWDLYTDAIATNRFGIGMSVNLMEIQAGDGAGFGFYPNAGTTSALHIISSGNVGIGTTAPSSKLQVTGGDVEIETVTSGIIMKAAGTSTRYRITLNATGDALVFTAV
jgi:hypothetical protein